MSAGEATRLDHGDDAGGLATLRQGLRISPELAQGWLVTALLALTMTGGRIVIPIAVQQTIDKGLSGPGGPDMSFVAWMCAVCAAGILVTAGASYLTTVRLAVNSERGLATMRLKAFRHVHDLPVLTQSTERRGALVSRVTSDVDTVSQFLQFGGFIFLVSIGQMLLATVVMFVYSWQLALVVLICFLPLFASLRALQRRMSDAYGVVRSKVGEMLSAIAEPVVGAQVVRAYSIEGRTQARIDGSVDDYRRTATSAQTLTGITFSIGGLAAGLANAGVLTAGVLLGVDGQATLGEILAFMFLVALFSDPVQIATQVLTDAQSAFAGWRRVLGVIATPADVVDPGESGVTQARGPITVEFADVDFAYPDGDLVLRDVDVQLQPHRRVAVVGETGSGKTTFAKLLTRLMDPTSGAVLLDGVDAREISFASLRERVVMVPQDGYLFDASLAENVRFGRPEVTDAELLAAFESLGLTDWLESLPDGLNSPVGQRGESLSAGERQLVALARANIADPDLLVLDEATSAVDPGTEVRVNAALERLMTGRTSVTIAHRLSTAEAADEVLVFDNGEIVERGPHAELVAAGGVYSRLHQSWIAQRSAL
ncbi:ABC transporter ATP-binding protein [Kribbella sandramycini]|uniref:ABC transporter ATP-binding protein n=1 Tax=Kribbella sandramycini TaxID=60450 RepID=A0A7Y4KU44_9ACTN|nr:ABC transporter ATP-binding protein [Kribbella sandramycini]MBB6568749.1 ABC-type multidrug transport system fused ATPase/permease subunit [Kribbella sandramycini]NOL38668.1 ABC transporter ATP-binding protein [Kribbella sandramycini]